MLRIRDSLGPMTSPNMKSDLSTGAALARAAIEGALSNVEVNLESLKDAEFANQARTRAKAIKL